MRPRVALVADAKRQIIRALGRKRVVRARRAAKDRHEKLLAVFYGAFYEVSCATASVGRLLRRNDTLRCVGAIANILPLFRVLSSLTSSAMGSPIHVLERAGNARGALDAIRPGKSQIARAVVEMV